MEVQAGKRERDLVLTLNVPDLQLAEVRAVLLGTALTHVLAQQWLGCCVRKDAAHQAALGTSVPWDQQHSLSLLLEL